MSGHTAGPWEIAPRSDTDELWEIVSEYSERDGKKIANWIAEVDAQIDTVEMSELEQEEAMNKAGANARLIAAAPDLLEALRAFVDRYVELVNCGDCGHWNPEEETEVITARAAIAKAEGREP